MKAIWSVLLMTTASISIAQCKHVEGQYSIDGGTDTDTDTGTDTTQNIPLDGVAMLVVVANSVSMGEEQTILRSAIPSLVTSITGGGGFYVDDMRFAVVTTDMGFSWGGHPYQDGDGWPEEIPPTFCSASGDDGTFQSNQGCPEGFAETTPQAPNSDIASQAACLITSDISGCGWEQQLQAAAVALNKPDNAWFVRENDLLVILVVSDEMDCSLEDGPGMFATDDVQDPGSNDLISRKNVACGNNQQYLYSTTHFADAFWQVKNYAYNAVLFAAIVGVPKNDHCQGTGDHISDCLEQPEMQLTEHFVLSETTKSYFFFEPACTRWDETDAEPGRRYVDLAVNKFGPNGYIYSICNPDWNPAMQDIAEMIERQFNDY